MTIVHAPPHDRVRANTAPEVTHRLDREAASRLRRDATRPADELAVGIDKLDAEWDIERVIEAEAALMGLTGLALATAAGRRFLVLPGFVAAMLLLHATHGWYPLLPLFRRAGFRTRDEIDRERYAVKAMRGDFAHVPADDAGAEARAEAAWRAVCS